MKVTWTLLTMRNSCCARPPDVLEMMLLHTAGCHDTFCRKLHLASLAFHKPEKKLHWHATPLQLCSWCLAVAPFLMTHASAFGVLRPGWRQWRWPSQNTSPPAHTPATATESSPKNQFVQVGPTPRNPKGYECGSTKRKLSGKSMKHQGKDTCRK